MNTSFEIAVCNIHVFGTELTIAVSSGEKELAEKEMEAAYECWSSTDEENCILPGYDEVSIQQSCYGDFIMEWLKEKGIKADEEIGLVPLDGYCCEDAPDGFDVSEWRDERVWRYWFDKNVLSNYLSSELNTSVEDYKRLCTPDDVDCDILQEVPFVLKATVITN